MRHENSNDDLRRLPPYGRSLLKISIPVSVTLAASKQPVSRVIELSPGSIIQFEKACDEMLNLEVGGRNIAEGEAVKVGDKFGLRVTSIVLPDERFRPVRTPASSTQPPSDSETKGSKAQDVAELESAAAPAESAAPGPEASADREISSDSIEPDSSQQDDGTQNDDSVK